MGDWYEAAVERLKLLYDILRKQILQSEYIHVDESTVPVIDNEKHKTRKGYEWYVLDGLSGDVMFYYDRGSRAANVARELLGGYKGNVQTDGYAAYDHRREVRNHPARMLGPSAPQVRRSAGHGQKTRHRGNHLYQQTVQGGVGGGRGKTHCEQRKEKRVKESYSVILVFEKCMKDTYPTVLPKSRTGQAIEYAFALLPRLSRYVNDGRISIDNNPVERAIRPLALRRKNWLFCGNDASAYRAAIVYSLIGTCKNAGIEPSVWMEDVLKQIPYYLRDGCDLAQLLPRAWASQNQL